MPSVFLPNNGFLREVVSALPGLPPCRWLLEDLEVYDCCGWPGGEKWAGESLFLSHGELVHDLWLRNFQMIWGRLAALPLWVDEAQARAASPVSIQLDMSWYQADRVFPRHPLAMAEILSCDSTYVLVTAREEELLVPLYRLPGALDNDRENQRTNRQLERIRRGIRSLCPQDPPPGEDLLRRCWRRLFREGPEPDDQTLLQTITAEAQRIKPVGNEGGTFL